MMRVLFFMVTVVGSLGCGGCGKKEPDPPKQQGFELRAPGVDIKIDRKDGVRVKAGDTEVKAKRGEGVDVKAPGVDVETKRD